MTRKPWWLSRKILTALITLLVVVFNDRMGLELDPTQITAVVITGLGLIFGIAYEDSKVIPALALKNKLDP